VVLTLSSGGKKSGSNVKGATNDCGRNRESVYDARNIDKDNAPGRPIPVPSDPSRQKRPEEELMEAKAEAELYLDLFSHDIRNLTQIGVGYIELALESSNIDEMRSLIAKALDAMQDTAHIIDNVRKLQDARDGNFEMKPVNLCTVLADLPLQSITSDKRDVKINIQTCPLGLVTANEMITDIFSNLINNSIRHSDPEKPLTINIKIDRIKEMGVDSLLCAVDDNGPGISDWVKDRIFQRFQPGEIKTHGKGLGLHIAKTLVEDYGGKMWVEDRVSGDYTQGARFVVVLPAA
jgi:signal transduction histidine kinase